MRWSDINEARLPLIKGDTKRLRGSYAAFIITMAPKDFLALTIAPGDMERIAAAEFPKNRDKFKDMMGGRDDDFGRFNMPFLTVEWPTGKVMQHEGRHRALMIDRQGGGVFPVAIFLRYQTEYQVTYERWNSETDETTKGAEDFTSFEEAKERADFLKSWNDRQRAAWGTPDEDEFDATCFFSVKIENLGGGTIKGSPSQENPDDPWDRKPYTAEDMPKQLVGQYDGSVVVTKFKVGVVKGYRHFK
jgi:hypothetical protein